MSAPEQSEQAANSLAGGTQFQTTHWSVVLAAGQDSSSQSREALESLCRSYWYPLYAYVRRRGYDPHTAQDLTQSFFARLIAKNHLGMANREKGKFRSFLLTSLSRFLADEWDREHTRKRGGRHSLISFDDPNVEERFRQEPVADEAPEQFFDRRWALTVLEQAFARIEREFVGTGKEKLFGRLKIFLSREPGAGEYDALAAELGLTNAAVATAVRRLRKQYRETIRQHIAQTVSSPTEVEDEMRYLLSLLRR